MYAIVDDSRPSPRKYNKEKTYSVDTYVHTSPLKYSKENTYYIDTDISFEIQHW